jgi:hypothetical protein
VHHTSRGRRLVAATLTLGVSSALLGLGAVVLAGAASAALIDVPETGQPGRLILSSDPYPAEFLDLSPGEPGYWQVAARIEDADSATLALQLQKDGDLIEHPRGLTMTVDACTTEWTGLTSTPACASGAQRVTAATPAEDYSQTSPSFDLAAIQSGAPRYLLVTLAVEDSATAMADGTLMGLTGDMGVGLTATAFDDVPVNPDAPGTPGGSLPRTGFDASALAAAAALAAGLLGLGTALRIYRKGAVR